MDWKDVLQGLSTSCSTLHSYLNYDVIFRYTRNRLDLLSQYCRNLYINEGLHENSTKKQYVVYMNPMLCRWDIMYFGLKIAPQLFHVHNLQIPRSFTNTVYNDLMCRTIGEYFPQLQILNLSNNHITSRGVNKYIAEIADFQI